MRSGCRTPGRVGCVCVWWRGARVCVSERALIYIKAMKPRFLVAPGAALPINTARCRHLPRHSNKTSINHQTPDPAHARTRTSVCARARGIVV